MAIEMATTLGEENKEIKSRLNDLESQVEKLQRLLALKDAQLSQLQSAKPAQPAAAKPIATPIEEDSNLPLYGGGIALALLGLFLARRRKKDQPAQNDNAFTQTHTTPIIDTNIEVEEVEVEESRESTVIEEEPLLSEFTPSEFDTSAHSQEADPLTECDVYIAYGRYQQAEDLIKNALNDDPDNLSYKLKLLDIYFSSRNADDFEEVAGTLTALKDSDLTTWNSIADMGADLSPDSPLFLSPLDGSDTTTKTTEDKTTEADSPEEVASEEFEFDFDVIKNEPTNDESEELLDELDTDIQDDGADNGNDTKLSLAQAYIEMEDFTSAKDALNEVLNTGDEDQKKLAQDMLDNL